ncbi:Dor1-like family protein [Anaerovirgula multivorans]|uniref:Dor1-like family protein n=1 Tax=Anaerovirgula multivorans TaxID=312168 RepID=A0A239BIK1_9FIRM|nr:hypothetical protein [Anaerovirgula multivorans]SNS07509.1 Dor1-like family protein [Anaerovirgula multivorans]
MSFTNKLSKAISQSMNEISKKSSEIIEVNKMNLSINKREKEIQELYEELGRHVYEHLQGGNYINKLDLESYISRIEFLKRDIETLEKLVLSIQKIKHCPRCEVEFNEDISYCPLCGKYIKDLQ